MAHGPLVSNRGKRIFKNGFSFAYLALPRGPLLDGYLHSSYRKDASNGIVLRLKIHKMKLCHSERCLNGGFQRFAINLLFQTTFSLPND